MLDLMEFEINFIVERFDNDVVIKGILFRKDEVMKFSFVMDFSDVRSDLLIEREGDNRGFKGKVEFDGDFNELMKMFSKSSEIEFRPRRLTNEVFRGLLRIR